MPTNDELKVILNAKNNLAPGMKSALNSIQKFQADAAAATAKGGGLGGLSMDAIAQSALKVAGSIEGIKGALKLASVATAAYKEDWDSVVNSIESMPVGLGEVAKATHALYDIWTDTAKEQERMDAMMKDNAATAARLALVKQYKEETAGVVENIEREIQLLNAASAADKSRLQSLFDYQDAHRKLNADIAKGAGGADVAARQGALNDLFKMQLQNAARDEQARLTEARSEQAKTIAKQQQERERDARREALAQEKESLEADRQAMMDKLNLAGAQSRNQLAIAGPVASGRFTNEMRGLGEISKNNAAVSEIAKQLKATEEANKTLKSIDDRLRAIDSAISRNNNPVVM